jgi:very-short-patch-repair endonuclease
VPFRGGTRRRARNCAKLDFWARGDTLVFAWKPPIEELPLANSQARSLRKRMTPQEVKLWVKLRELKGQGLHFRRQVPRRDFIIDFACLKPRVLVEVDGSQHGMDGHLRRDQVRDRILAADGFVMLRFWNTEIDHNLDGVVETIFAACMRAGRVQS